MDKLKSWIRTHKKTATVIGAALVAGLVALIYWLWTRYRGGSSGTVSAQPAGMIYSPGSGGAGGGQAGGDTSGGSAVDVASMIDQQTQAMTQGLSQMFQQLTQSQQEQMKAFQEMEQQNQQSIQQMMQAQQEQMKSMLTALQPPAPQAPAVPQPPVGVTNLSYNYKYAVPTTSIAGGSGGGLIYADTLQQLEEFARGGSRNVGGNYSIDFRGWQPTGAVTNAPQRVGQAAGIPNLTSFEDPPFHRIVAATKTGSGEKGGVGMSVLDNLLAPKPPDVPDNLWQIMIDAAKQYQVDPYLLAAIANHETHFGKDPGAGQKGYIMGYGYTDKGPIYGATDTPEHQIMGAAQLIHNTIGSSAKYDWNSITKLGQVYATDPGWATDVWAQYFHYRFGLPVPQAQAAGKTNQAIDTAGQTIQSVKQGIQNLTSPDFWQNMYQHAMLGLAGIAALVIGVVLMWRGLGETERGNEGANN